MFVHIVKPFYPIRCIQKTNKQPATSLELFEWGLSLFFSFSSFNGSNRHIGECRL